ncbi:MAG: hypothetical protein K1X64_02830 [Myxococcaceae bacterium]|nr:hypothetical protein [Myxococcaceae bacterium]
MFARLLKLELKINPRYRSRHIMTVVSKKPPTSAPVTAPSPKRTKETQTDGAWIDANGIGLPYPLSNGSLTPVRPAYPSSETVAVFVNGILFSADQHFKSLQEVADATGFPVIGLHNATSSLFEDLIETVRQKLGYATKDPSVRALTEYLTTGLETKKEMVLIAHSQGALVISLALQNVVDAMRKKGMTDTQIESRLKAVRVETYGGVARGFPNGPHYRHFVNRQDALPKLIGPGATTLGLWISKARQLGIDQFEPGIRNDSRVTQIDLGVPTAASGEYLPSHGLELYLGFRAKNKE